MSSGKLLRSSSSTDGIQRFLTSCCAFRIFHPMYEFRLHHITRHKTYTDGKTPPKTIVALDDVTADIFPACITCILGASGSGKSTLLRLLNGLESPDAGEIFWRDKPLADYPPRELRRRVALVSQIPALFDGTVRQNLLFAFVAEKRAYLPTEEQLNDTLRLVNLEPSAFLDRPTSALSIGEKQRVMLARALLRSPEVLLLDEPTAALDTESTAIVEASILRLQERLSIACVWVTHLPGQARRVACQILVLKSGRLVHAMGKSQDSDRFLAEFERTLER